MFCSNNARRGLGRSRRGFTLVELLIVIGIIALLMSIILPAIKGVQEQAVRIKCSNNLRQLAQAMAVYSAGESEGGFPRTKYDPQKKQLLVDNAGYKVADTFGNSGYVGENNVPASLFLLFKTQKLPPELFICPATDATPGFVTVSRQTSSNWERFTDNVTYSLATPFPSVTAGNSGFVWNRTLSPDFALIADINPGTRGGVNPANNSVGPAHNATPTQMAAANSNNHRNKGQNVVYADSHVEFSATPYCGAMRPGFGRDNIYTAGAGDGGITSELAMPVDKKDSVMLPTDDPGGK